jgi:hypothetical protein
LAGPDPRAGAVEREPALVVGGDDVRQLGPGERQPVRGEGGQQRVDVGPAGVVEDEADASPDEAAAAMRRMLREAGFEDRFIGRLPIVALTVRPSRAGELRRRVAEAFARQSPLTIPGTAWVEFVVDLLRPAAELLPLVERVEPLSAAPPPLRRGEVRLGAPSRDDAWRVYAETGSAAGATPAAPPAAPVPLALDDGPLADSADGKKSYLWPAVALALCMVIGILVGMAMMQHAHEPGGKATQEASSKAAAY